MTESTKSSVRPPEFKVKVGLKPLGEMTTIHQIAQAHGVHAPTPVTG